MRNTTTVVVLLLVSAGLFTAPALAQSARGMATIHTADMLLGHDQFCMEYLKGVRSGAIES